jgi:hypothetical protein
VYGNSFASTGCISGTPGTRGTGQLLSDEKGMNFNPTIADQCHGCRKCRKISGKLQLPLSSTAGGIHRGERWGRRRGRAALRRVDHF